MPKIFISYRRDDTQYTSQTMYLLMGRYFGIENVSLSADSNSQNSLETIAGVDVVLLIVGQHWDALMPENGRNDSTRIELESALRQKKIVIPVLVKDADIPDSIVDLNWHSALSLRDAPHMEDDCKDLLIAIEDAIAMRDYQYELPASVQNTKSPAYEENIPSFKDLISNPTIRNKSPERRPTLSRGNSRSNAFEWIEIPAGRILVKGNRYSYLPTDYQKIVFVEAFSITKYPVTNLQYASYVSATGRTPEYWTNPKFNQPHQPVVGISWFDVMAYCDWVSAQLEYELMIPTEHQWQRAAQGDDERQYPWGDRWNSNFANTDEKINHTSPVYQYPRGASPYGVMDMAGNVWEWCFAEPGMKEFLNAYVILCGGSWLNYSMFATIHARNTRLPNMDYTDVGFRLIRF